MVTVMTVVSARGFNEEKARPSTLQSEIVFCMMVSLLVCVLSRSRQRADREETIRQSEARHKRSQKGKNRTKSSRCSNVKKKSSETCSRASEVEAPLPVRCAWDINDELLEERLCETLDRDLKQDRSQGDGGDIDGGDDCSESSDCASGNF